MGEDLDFILESIDYEETIFEKYLPNLYDYWEKYLKNCVSTLQMFLIAGVIAFAIGLIFGIILVVTKPDGIKPKKGLYSVLTAFVNIFRSVPFVIMIVFLIPFTRFVVGTAIGVKGAIIPLIFGCVPFYARQVESALSSVNPGKIEAARSMGSGTLELIFRVYLHESVPELIRASTITAISLVGLTTTGGAVGAGGLGDFAINYGQGLNHSDIIWACLLILVAFISLLQFTGSFFAKKTTNRELFKKKLIVPEGK
ncbi:MAG: ABC transporter permease [Treponema sp.]|nr:ABC transporter permease [Treponema sp.]